MAEPLIPLITVHCFFGSRCGHTEQGVDPREVHGAMEGHYQASHQADIAAITGPVRVRVIPGVWWVMS